MQPNTQPDTNAVPIEKCKHCGTDAPVDVHVCPRCDRILTLGRHGDYFTFFGLHRRLQVDPRDQLTLDTTFGERDDSGTFTAPLATIKMVTPVYDEREQVCTIIYCG